MKIDFVGFVLLGILVLILLRFVLIDLLMKYRPEKIRYGKRSFVGKEIDIGLSSLVKSDTVVFWSGSIVRLYAFGRQPFELEINGCKYRSTKEVCGGHSIKQLKRCINIIKNPDRTALKLSSKSEIYVEIPARK